VDLKALDPMLVTLLGTYTSVNKADPSNVETPIEFTVDIEFAIEFTVVGQLNVLRAVLKKALSPMVSTLLGIYTSVNEVQFTNVFTPIAFILVGQLNVLRAVP